MLYIENWKKVAIIGTCLLGIAYASPNAMSKESREWAHNYLPGWLPSKTVSLGLDLQGGSHILLEADVKAIMRERMDAMLDTARSEMRKQEIGYVSLEAKDNGISFKLRNPKKDRDAAYKIVRSLEQRSDINIEDTGEVEITLNEAAIKEIDSQVINQSIEIVRRRIDETGTKEPIIQRQGEKRIVVQLPGVDDPEHIKNLIGKTAKMTFHLVDSNVGNQVSLSSDRLPMRDNPEQFINVKKRVMISGDMLVDAQATFQQGQPVVAFKFNAIGAKKFCDVTRENVGQPFAIVLDNEVISAPVIQDSICGGSGIISGKFGVKEANDLSLLLRAGALPAPLNVVEERSVGPTLGSDSIDSGIIAAEVALGAVFLFMFTSYGLFGMFANFALILNMTMIFALLSMLQATLTLPGIAGIILTIGMAVDANVLIYERIREEIKQGRTVISAIDTGYRMAMSTIVDSNLTTMIVAIILFSFGTGPVKGFAVTMTIGTVTSMFSAILLTRLIVVTWLRKTKPSKLDL